MFEIMTKKEYCMYEDNYLRCTRKVIAGRVTAQVD